MKRVILLLLICCMHPVAAEEKMHIYMLAGQSNANKYVYRQLKKHITKKHGRNAMLLYIRHGGTPLIEWIKGDHPEFTIAQYYRRDFFSPQGTGHLQKRIRELESKEKSWEFTGLFWMQGESDTQNWSSAKSYTKRFKYLYTYLSKDLGGRFPVCLGVIDVANIKKVPIYSKDWEQRIEKVRHAQNKICATINDEKGGRYACRVDSRGLERIIDHKPSSTDTGDFVHLSKRGSRDLANKMWTALQLIK